MFGGNPAAVVTLDEWLADDVLQAIATENNLAETAFVVPREDMALPRAWSTMTAGASPIQVLLNRVGSTGTDPVRNQLQRIVQERFSEGPIRLTNVATLGSGTAA